MVINQTLLTGIFPNKLKIAKVIPLFKKGDKSIIENYRPISILPSISKVFEKIIFNQLYDHFQKHNLFFNGQYGFRRNHSTELATLDLIEKIHHQLDTHKNPFAIFLDLSKAFDTIDHDILLTKLYYYGIRNQVLCLFKNYLSSRSQYISMGEIKSSLRNINTGVPQGSILGPLLFLIYINDIHTVSNKFDYILYADDTTLVSNTSTFKSHNNQLTISENISIELLKISDWIAVNKLSLNAKKSKYILFHHIRNKRDSGTIVNLQINSTKIQRVSDFNFLGVTINEHIDWSPHINKLSNKISRTLGVMNKLKRCLPHAIMKLMYNSLIQTHLYFGITVWGYNCARISKLQKRAIRIISNSRYNAHTEPFFKDLAILKVGDIFKMQCLKLYYNIRHNRTPALFTTLLTYNNTVHAHNTRQLHDIHISGTRTTLAHKCFSKHLPKLLRIFPELVLLKIDTHSYSGFSRYTRQYLLQQYSYLCLIRNCHICAHL